MFDILAIMGAFVAPILITFLVSASIDRMYLYHIIQVNYHLKKNNYRIVFKRFNVLDEDEMPMEIRYPTAYPSPVIIVNDKYELEIKSNKYLRHAIDAKEYVMIRHHDGRVPDDTINIASRRHFPTATRSIMPFSVDKWPSCYYNRVADRVKGILHPFEAMINL